MRRNVLVRILIGSIFSFAFLSQVFSGDLLIDNRVATYHSGDELSFEQETRAQAFSTGSDSFVVRAIVVNLEATVESQVQVKLWSGPGSVPVALVEDFGTQTVSAIGITDVSFSSVECPVLDANTRYWISVTNGSGNFDWTITSDTASGGDGVLDNVVSESGDAGATWPTSTAPGNYRRFAVEGAVPGEVDTTFTPPASLNLTVRTMLPRPDGKMIIAGSFTDLGGDLTLDRIARLEADGTIDTSFDPPADLSDEVNCVAQQPDGKLILGGSFEDVAANPDRDRLIRLNTDGSLDTTFNPPLLNQPVWCVLVQADGKVVVGGGFGSVGGDNTLNNIARLNSDGTVDETFDPPGDITSSVFCIAMQTDGKLVLGGGFSDVGDGTDHDKILRLHSDGSLDTSFVPVALDIAAVPYYAIVTLNIQPDGKIIAGGEQQNIAGNMTHDRLMRIEADGSLDATFTPPDNLNGLPYTASLQADGKIVVGGFFTDVGGDSSLDRMMRLNIDGSLDDSFHPPENLNSSVSGLTHLPDGRIMIGGTFTNVGGVSAHDRLLRLESDKAICELNSPDLATLRLMRGGSAPEANSVLFESSTDGGVTFSLLGEGTRISGGWEYTGDNIPKVGTIRALAFVSGGYNNGSYSIHEKRLEVYTPSSPTISLKGKKRIRTSRRSYTVRGFATDPDNDVAKVRYKDSRPRGRRFRNARGTVRWKAPAKLKDRRNSVIIQAYDSRGAKSKRLRVIIIKR